MKGREKGRRDEIPIQRGKTRRTEEKKKRERERSERREASEEEDEERTEVAISRSTYISIYREARFEASHERAGWPESEVDGRKRVGSLIQIGEETPERTRKTV